MNQYKSKGLGIGTHKIGDQVTITEYNNDCLVNFNCVNMVGEIVFYKLGYYTQIKIDNQIGFFSDREFK